jgi:iron(III) transport system ATP-binding protein
MLSGGEQQRIALARAVVPRPSVLLMDEPFSGLDRRLRDEVRDDTLAVLRESRVTCIAVTHDPEEALRMADRIALMRAGRLVQVADPETIYRKPVDLAAARYFCELNEVAGRVSGGAVETPLGKFAALGLPEGAEAVVAIRPQGVRLVGTGAGLAARLEGRRFLGELELLEFGVPGLDQRLRARVRPVSAVDHAGKGEVTIAIDPAEVLVFAAAGA